VNGNPESTLRVRQYLRAFEGRLGVPGTLWPIIVRGVPGTPYAIIVRGFVAAIKEMRKVSLAAPLMSVPLPRSSCSMSSGISKLMFMFGFSPSQKPAAIQLGLFDLPPIAELLLAGRRSIPLTSIIRRAGERERAPHLQSACDPGGRAAFGEDAPIVLSDRDRQQFLQALDHPPRPIAALERLMVGKAWKSG
jgi:hypothetical protein